MESVSGFVIPHWIMRWALQIVGIKNVKSQAVTLPHDVILEILSKLPVKFLLRFRCVSKSWDFIISDPNFLKLLQMSDNPSLLYHPELPTERNLNILSFDSKHSLFSDAQLYIPREVMGGRNDWYKILGSCNGLICVHVSNFRGLRALCHGDFILWNPSTRQVRILPEYPLKQPLKDRFGYKLKSSYGFGYDGLTDDYKLVIAAMIAARGDSKTVIFVFSVKSNTWGCGRVYDTEWSGSADEEGIHLDGILHWLTPYRKVNTFDLGTEEIGKIWLPEYSSSFSCCIFLGTLNGWLCFWYYTDYNLRIVVWVMKEYGVKSSWTKLLVVGPEIWHVCMRTSIEADYSSRHVFVPFFLCKEEDELLCLVKRNNQEWVAVKFNLRNSNFEEVLGLRQRIHRYCFFPHMESLVPIRKSLKTRDCFAFWSHLY